MDSRDFQYEQFEIFPNVFQANSHTSSGLVLGVCLVYLVCFWGPVIIPPNPRCDWKPTDSMSRDGSGWINGERINGLFHLLINGVYPGCNPVTNLLLPSWDIQVRTSLLGSNLYFTPPMGFASQSARVPLIFRCN